MRATGAASIALLLVCASVGSAAPGWSPAVPLAPPIALLSLQLEMSIALDPLENAVAIWNANGIIEAAAQQRGGPWSAATDISQPANYEDTYEPQAAMAPLGTALASFGPAMAIWTSSTAVPQQPRVNAIKAAMRLRNGTWTAPVVLITSTTAAFGSPRLALDLHGNAVAVWQSTSSGQGVIQAATRPNGGAWSVPVVVSPAAGDASFPQLALNPLGQAVAVWQLSAQPGNPNLVQAASKDSGGGWSAPVDISTPTPQTWSPHVAIDAVGHAVAVWNQATRIMAATRGADGRWATPIALSSAGSPSYCVPAVAMDLDGKTMAAWSETSGVATMHTSTRPNGGAWAAPVHLSGANEDVSDPRVAIATGKSFMVVTWVDNATNLARAAATGPSGWGAPVTLGSGIWSSTVEVAATIGARARALWGRPVAPPVEAWAPVVSSYAP